MGDSLQDQLRALGLAQETGRKREKAASKGKRRPAGQNTRPAASSGELSLDRAWALREQAERREAEAARQRKLEEERRRREINQSIRAIVTEHRNNADDGDVARHFLYRGRIRKLYVTAGQQRALAEGELGIVYLSGSYHLLPREQADAVRAISPQHVVDLDAAAEEESDHPVPDDLLW